jgi:hypothetical protein
MYAPRLIVKYWKTPVWKSRFGPSFWDIDTGSWNGLSYEPQWQPGSQILQLEATGSWATSGGNLVGFSPMVRFTHTITGGTMIGDLRNTDGDDNILDADQRDTIASGEQVVMWNYNDLAFNDGTTAPWYALKLNTTNTGQWPVWELTNIEFLEP